ncbi:MAG: hypothetical protein J6M31_00750 [Bacteroidales bacterium]|nr:hypothetical protein [Bacteroidales bacterium]
MCWFGNNRNKAALETEVASLHFSNPLGLALPSDKLRQRLPRRYKAGFVTLTPPQDAVLDWIVGLQQYRSRTVLGVNLHTDIVRSFSLVYDFADFLILDPDSDHGIDSPDIADTSALLEEVVSLRLCYEHYTPVFLRLTHGDTPDELPALLGQSRLYGLDGIVAASPAQLRLVREITLGRVPVIGVADDAATAQEMLAAGASLVETHLRCYQLDKLLKQLEKREI